MSSFTLNNPQNIEKGLRIVIVKRKGKSSGFLYQITGFNSPLLNGRCSLFQLEKHLNKNDSLEPPYPTDVLVKIISSSPQINHSY